MLKYLLPKNSGGKYIYSTTDHKLNIKGTCTLLEYNHFLSSTTFVGEVPRWFHLNNLINCLRPKEVKLSINLNKEANIREKPKNEKRFVLQKCVFVF